MIDRAHDALRARPRLYGLMQLLGFLVLAAVSWLLVVLTVEQLGLLIR